MILFNRDTLCLVVFIISQRDMLSSIPETWRPHGLFWSLIKGCKKKDISLISNVQEQPTCSSSYTQSGSNLRSFLSTCCLIAVWNSLHPDSRMASSVASFNLYSKFTFSVRSLFKMSIQLPMHSCIFPFFPCFSLEHIFYLLLSIACKLHEGRSFLSVLFIPVFLAPRLFSWHTVNPQKLCWMRKCINEWRPTCTQSPF